MKKMLLSISLLLTIIFSSNKLFAEAAIVSDPTLTTIVETNANKQYLKMIETATDIKTQIDLAKQMSKDLRDGDISPEMIDFASTIANKCGYKPPKVLLPDFPNLNLNNYICKNGSLPFTEIKKNFSFSSEKSNEERRLIVNNIEKLRKDSYVYSLTLGVSTRAVDVNKDIEDITQQMQNPSLANQMYVNNEIQLIQLNQLNEIRRLLGALLENTAIDKVSSFDIGN